MVTVTIINPLPYKEQPVPELNKKYHMFDDGKISESRHYVVKIVEVIPFEECSDTHLISFWEDEQKEAPWLYAEETDYIVKGVSPRILEPQYFVRTVDGGWFSLGWWGSRLDIDGSLYAQLCERTACEEIR